MAWALTCFSDRPAAKSSQSPDGGRTMMAFFAMTEILLDSSDRLHNHLLEGVSTSARQARISSRTLDASSVITKGLVTTIMPGSRLPFPTAAFSA